MHQLSIFNHTENILAVTLGEEAGYDISVNPGCHGTLTSKMWRGLATLKLGCLSLTDKGLQNNGQPLVLKLSKRPSNPKCGWELVRLPAHANRCTIYRIALTKNDHQLIVFPKRPLASFLADMPPSVPLSSLLLPGTHDSVAFFGWPISQCQDLKTPLAAQFSSGIRVLDIRLAVIDGVLISYHGIYPERLPFLDILKAVHTFLTSPEGIAETIVMSIKQEDQASLLFSQLVHSAVYNGPGGRAMWFLENRIPTLGEVRGKVVLFSRFGGDGYGWEGGLEGLGIHPPIWPDSQEEGFEYWLKGTQVKTHDWYAISSFLYIPEKAARASRILHQPDTSDRSPVLSITFLSGASFPLAPPSVVACGFGWPSWGLGVEGVNSRVGRWILSFFSKMDAAMGKDESILLDLAGPRLRGWCMMDFFTEPVDIGLVTLLVECNYRGRRSGEEGWPLIYDFSNFSA